MLVKNSYPQYFFSKRHREVPHFRPMTIQSLSLVCKLDPHQNIVDWISTSQAQLNAYIRFKHAHTSIFSEYLKSRIRTPQIMFRFSSMRLIAGVSIYKTNASQRI